MGTTLRASEQTEGVDGGGHGTHDWHGLFQTRDFITLFSSESGSTVLYTLKFDLYVLCTKFKKKIIY